MYCLCKKVIFGNEEATNFKMATTEGQHIEDLQGEEVFQLSRMNGSCLWMQKLRKPLKPSRK